MHSSAVPIKSKSHCTERKRGFGADQRYVMFDLHCGKNALDFVTLFDLHLKLQVAFCEIMQVDTRPFDDFIHQHRPHPGQLWVAKAMRLGLESSEMLRVRKR